MSQADWHEIEIGDQVRAVGTEILGTVVFVDQDEWGWYATVEWQPDRFTESCTYESLEKV